LLEITQWSLDAVVVDAAAAAYEGAKMMMK